MKQVHAVRATNHVWQADITCLVTAEGELYLAALMNAFSHRIIGRDFSQSLHADIAINAFQRARQCRGWLL